MSRLLWLLFLLSPCVAPAQDPPLLKAKDLQNDWIYLTKSLLKIHPDLYRYQDSIRVHTLSDSLFGTLTGHLTYLQFYARLKLFLGALRDGHLTSALPRSVEHYYETRIPVFPLSLDFHERFANVSCNARTHVPKGKEVLGIGRQSMNDIRRRLYQYISADGSNVGRKDWILSRNFWFYYLMVYGQQDSFVIYSRAMEEPEFYLDVRAISFSKNVCSNSRVVDSPLLELKWQWMRGAILSIRTFNEGELNEKGYDFHRFLRESFEAIRKEDIRKLIIDIRGNGGGKDEYGVLLYSYLAQRPFRYYRSLRTRERELAENENPLLGVHRPAKNRFNGEVIVVTNGGTFSAAAEFCSIVKSNKRGIFVGEETGGAYAGNNSGRMERIILPKSGISVSIPTVRYEMAVDDTAHSTRGVLPDIAPNVWPYHYEKKGDPLLEAAIKEVMVP